MGEVVSVDPIGKSIEVHSHEPGETEPQIETLAYDWLLVAAGATHSYFGHDDWEELAPGLKTIEDATEIRGRVFAAFEAAENEPDPQRRSELMTFVVIGGGPTGVELAGAIAELARQTLKNDFATSIHRRQDHHRRRTGPDVGELRTEAVAQGRSVFETARRRNVDAATRDGHSNGSC